MTKYNEKRKATNQKWDSANITRITVAIPIEQKAKLQQRASEEGKSLHNYIITCLEHETGLLLHKPQQPQSKTKTSDTKGTDNDKQ